MKFSKGQLDTLASFFGLVSGVCTVLVTSEIISPKFGGAIGGISTVLLGIITQRPAGEHPDTAEAEREERR